MRKIILLLLFFGSINIVFTQNDLVFYLNSSVQSFRGYDHEGVVESTRVTWNENSEHVIQTVNVLEQYETEYLGGLSHDLGVLMDFSLSKNFSVRSGLELEYLTHDIVVYRRSSEVIAVLSEKPYTSEPFNPSTSTDNCDEYTNDPVDVSNGKLPRTRNLYLGIPVRINLTPDNTRFSLYTGLAAHYLMSSSSYYKEYPITELVENGQTICTYGFRDGWRSSREKYVPLTAAFDIGIGYSFGNFLLAVDYRRAISNPLGSGFRSINTRRVNAEAFPMQIGLRVEYVLRKK